MSDAPKKSDESKVPSLTFDDMEEDLNTFIDAVMEDDDGMDDDLGEDSPKPLQLADNEELDSLFDETGEEGKQPKSAATAEEKSRQEQQKFDEDALLQKANLLTATLVDDNTMNGNDGKSVVPSRTDDVADITVAITDVDPDSQGDKMASDSPQSQGSRETYAKALMSAADQIVDNSDTVAQHIAGSPATLATYVGTAADVVVDRSDQVAEQIADGVEAAINYISSVSTADQPPIYSRLSSWWQGTTSSS